jgi:hypothetical protein
MSRHIDRKAVLTIAVLLLALAMAALRTHQWRVPAPLNDWSVFRPKRVSSNPEDAIYSMLDAARTGDVRAYVDSFSGPLRDQLLQSVRESTELKFSSYLISQNAAFQGVAVTVTDRPSIEEARVRVEYVYSNRNEVQNLGLKTEGNRWKIVTAAAAEPIKTLIPYGTDVTD